MSDSVSTKSINHNESISSESSYNLTHDNYSYSEPQIMEPVPPPKFPLSEREQEIRKEVWVQLNRYTHTESMEDIEGALDVKMSVMEPLVVQKYYSNSSQARICNMNILICGSSGTGKTHIVKAAAQLTGRKLLLVRPSFVLDEFSGVGEKRIGAIFELAEACAPSIILLDEIDSFCRNRSANESEHRRSQKNELIACMNQLTCRRIDTAVIGTTNTPWEIDPAFRNRFGTSVYARLPNRLERIQIIRSILTVYELNVDLRDEDYNYIGIRTENLSGRELRDIIAKASAYQTKELTSVILKGKKVIPIDQAPPLRTVTLMDFSAVISSFTLVDKRQAISRMDRFMGYADSTQCNNMTTTTQPHETTLVEGEDSCCGRVIDYISNCCYV